VYEEQDYSVVNRRRRRSGLKWALGVSLLLNHTLVLPGAYLLLHQSPKRSTPETLEVELVPAPKKEAELPRLQRKLAHKPPPPKARPVPPQQQKKAIEEQKQQPPRPRHIPRLKMVEVNNPESKTAPEDARYLSDKNRRVLKETRARHTNLKRDLPRPRSSTRPNPRKEKSPGVEKKKIAEDRKNKQRPQKVSPLLAMRRPPTPRQRTASLKRPAEDTDDGDLPRPAKPQLQLHLDYLNHDRIYGKEAKRQREQARLSPSTSHGAHRKQWEQVRSALENFIPEVQPGNQTALGTRADPFALYIARMHRKIHKLWGFGFLVDLDLKPDAHPMNDMAMWSMIEVVVAPDGKVDKATIVKHSGYLPYDVAALDTIFRASPYPITPRNIRSKDGKVYMHWRFHRNQRQCGTFGVDPYILTKPPRGPIDSDMAEVGRAPESGQRGLRRLNRPRSGPSAGRSAPRMAQKSAPPAVDPGEHEEAIRIAQAAAKRQVDPQDPAARKAVDQFLSGLKRRDAEAMARSCGLPFMARGREVANSHADLQRILQNLIDEAGQEPLSRLKLMSVMQARQALGRLPAGAEYSEQMLVGQTKLGKVPLTLLLQRQRGSWKVVGLNR